MRQYFVIICLLVVGGVSPAAEFKVACDMPFKNQTQWNTSKVVDCDIEGDPSGSAENRNQNHMKNNFCAAGNPVSISFGTIDALQNAVDQKKIPYGSGQRLPPDRSLLQKLVRVGRRTIGEGSVVRLVAFIIDAHYSNVSNGETVNCMLHGEDNNDIHIMLGWNVGDDVCQSVTAEMLPHFRPDAWTPDGLNSLNGRLVRITGQLFLDGSHKPCQGAKQANPPRRSVWEIHPVYAIDVAKVRGSLHVSPSSANDWVPFDQFIKQTAIPAEPE